LEVAAVFKAFAAGFDHSRGVAVGTVQDRVFLMSRDYNSTLPHHFLADQCQQISKTQWRNLPD
jgi:hypothetical protein